MQSFSFKIIQGGMGVAVSNWCLARAVAREGQLGVVSGTGLAVVFARRLQQGDAGGHLRRAAGAFPFPEVARRVVDQFFVEGGKSDSKPFKPTPPLDWPVSAELTDLTVLANFCEVWLAKEGHDGRIGVNYLEKIQLPMLAQLFGAMLAGVDFVLIGAGIPRYVPGVLDGLARWEPVEMRIDVDGAQPGEEWVSRFDPSRYPAHQTSLQRPTFFAIVSSATLAMTLARKSNGKVDGFVVESSVAGGHNAPPRGAMQLTPTGEPVYGTRDDVELDKIRALDLPFFLAGGEAAPGKLDAAIALGASGIQVGTAFAFCDESGIAPDYKHRVIETSQTEGIRVFTDPAASPTSFPFKVVQLPGTLSDHDVYTSRRRVCDLGYLRKTYRKPDGTLGHRCPAEPVEAYVRKGGKIDDTTGRKCVCNALFATVGQAQRLTQTASLEPALLTAGSTQIDLQRFCKPGATSYKAVDVIRQLLRDHA